MHKKLTPRKVENKKKLDYIEKFQSKNYLSLYMVRASHLLFLVNKMTNVNKNDYCQLACKKIKMETIQTYLYYKLRNPIPHINI